MRTVAVVLAGGSGTRLGGTEPKQLQLLAGRTLVEHCVAAFDQAAAVDEVLVVVPPELVASTRELLGSRYAKLGRVIAGGADRPGSARKAIAALAPGHPGDDQADSSPADSRPADRATADSSQDDTGDCNVLLHDGARPLVDQRIIADCVSALATSEAVGVVVRASDTIVGISDGLMAPMPPRETLGHCQTPQGFRHSVISEAYRRADADLGAAVATDDCGVVLRYLPEVPVRVVPGSRRNIKITFPGDLEAARLLLETAQQY